MVTMMGLFSNIQIELLFFFVCAQKGHGAGGQTVGGDQGADRGGPGAHPRSHREAGGRALEDRGAGGCNCFLRIYAIGKT